jgi:carboxyl-terminal processing protease
MSVSKSGIRLLIIALLLLIAGAIAGGFYQKRKVSVTTRPSAPGSEVTKGFSDGLQLIENHYVTEADHERLTKTAVQQMLHTLDPHSNFFDRREFTEMQQEQNSRFYGVGVTINQRAGRVYVLGVTKGMPAEKAGLRYGDAIVAVDGKPAKNWTQADTLRHVRGEKGVPVDITVERAGQKEPLTFKVMRDEIPLPSVRNHFMIRSGVGYIALIGGFNQTTSDEVQTAIEDLKKQGMTSLLLDLRRNPGGLLREAVRVSEYFLPGDRSIVSVRGRAEIFSRQQTYTSRNTDPESFPLVVLINGESASAAEIVAGAIQDQDRGLIVGEDSFGKGLVQTLLKLPGGTGLTLTTARYYTPSGRSIQRDYSGLSLYDYYAARRLAEGAEASGQVPVGQPTPKDHTVYTPTGRPLYGGGGIKPDIIAKRRDEDVRWRDACFEFARLLAAGEIAGLEEYKVRPAETDARLRSHEFPVTESVMNAFRNFLRERTELSFLQNGLAGKMEYARRRIRSELVTAAYGVEAGEQIAIENDEQVQQSIEALPRARQLTETARLFTRKADSRQ